MTRDRITEIFYMIIEKPEYSELLLKNVYDISWLKQRLEYEEYTRLEDIILAYGCKNDEILFSAGFQFAWELFQQCNQ